MKLTLAKAHDFDEVKNIFKPHRATFPYLRNDYLKQAIDEDRCIYHQGVVIIYRNYKRATWISTHLANKNDCVILEIVKKSHSQTNTSQVIQSFFSMMNTDVWLTVRANNKVARSFYKKNGMSNVGSINWSNGKVKGRIYKKSKPTDKYGIWNLTPVEKHDIYYKRDDLYQPFEANSVNGGKLRQAVALIEQDLTTIRKEFNNTIITQSQVKSPQGAIIGRVAKEFGIKAIICVGGVSMKNIAKHHQLIVAREMGVEIRNVAGHGIPSVVNYQVKEIAKRHDYYNIGFGIHTDASFSAIFDTTANQVRNLPDNLNMLIVPVAAGIQIAGILWGLQKYNKRVDRVIGIEVGPARKKKILKYVDVKPTGFELKSFDMPFSKEITETFADSIPLDTLYESKAYNYMKHHLRIKNKKVCFWVVGIRP